MSTSSWTRRGYRDSDINAWPHCSVILNSSRINLSNHSFKVNSNKKSILLLKLRTRKLIQSQSVFFKFEFCSRTAVANRRSARKFWWSVEKFGHYLQFLCSLYCFNILLYYSKQAATNTTLIILL
jgi:hypothetical protein